MTEEKNLYSSLSPKYIVKLVPQVEEAIWSLFDSSKYKNVRRYISRWHESDDGGSYNNYWENFQLYYKDEERTEIDLAETLHNIPNDLLIKIAIDVGVDTPGFLPSVPIFKNIIKDRNHNAFQSFDRAIKNSYEHPQDSISLANATLEAIIKTIMESGVIDNSNFNSRDTLYDQTQNVLKAMKLFPGNHQEIEEITKIGSGLLTVSQNIEKLRSSKTDSHGRSANDYLISDPLWAIFVINAVSSVGLLLLSIFDTYYKKEEIQEKIDDIDEDVPF